jgi:RNAse (barnase) inhibitor barstar
MLNDFNRGHRTQKGFLYVKNLDELLEALSGNVFSPMLFTTFIHGHEKNLFFNCLKRFLSKILALLI